MRSDKVVLMPSAVPAPQQTTGVCEDHGQFPQQVNVIFGREFKTGCPECSRIRITADGKLKPCLHSDVEIALRGLSGEELEQAIRRGILMKPERHHMDETGVTETHRGMFAIGG